MSDREHPLAEPIREGTRRMLDMTRQPSTRTEPRTPPLLPEPEGEGWEQKVIITKRDLHGLLNQHIQMGWDAAIEAEAAAPAVITETNTDLRRLAEQATPGPWAVGDDGYIEGPDDPTYGRKLHWDTEGLGAIWRNEADAAYIAAANPQRILALLDELRDARVAVDEWADITAAAERKVAALEEFVGYVADWLHDCADDNPGPDSFYGFSDIEQRARALLAAEPAASLDIDATTQAMWDEKADEIARGDQR